ncbi:serine hydrolase domain-containing protein [Pleionea sediminis]|uniref:serine hydrolase domain-containing protein n=1 Tax=Pleionea sediminis TaxID=2569479 RepID=UPI00197C7D99|nr:serine hydrolase domain-containing protein [Pleionea sediminis]
MYWLLSVVFLLPLALQASTNEELQAFLDKMVKETDAPSLSAAVAVDGKIFAAASGYANTEKKLPATTDTQYRTGSVAKVIATTAFMTLVEQGKVTLEDDVRSYLSYLPKKRWPYSIAHILTHTSGIRHYNFGEYGSNTHYPTLEEATKVFRDDDLLFQPGTGYTYSTYGINLIQGIIEKTTGKTLSEFLEATLFSKASMKNTALEFHDKTYPNFAVGYRSFLTSLPVKNINVSNKYVGGGMITTPTDLVSMMIALNDGRLVKPKTKLLMWSIPFPKVAPDRAYGWEWISRNGIKLVSHGGAINGFESFLIHDPKRNLTVAVMVNRDGYDHTSRTTFGIFDLFTNDESAEFSS